MGNLVFNYKDSSLILNLDKKEKPDKKLVETLQGYGFPNVLSFKFSQQKRAFRYDIENLVSLQSRFKKATTYEEFTYVVNQFFVSLEEIYNLGVPPFKVDYDLDNIFIDENGLCFFVVYPIAKKTAEGSPLSSLMTLIKNAKPLLTSDEERFNELRTQIQAMIEAKTARPAMLAEIKQYIRGFAESGLGFDNSQLKALINGSFKVEDFQEKEVELVEIQGVEVDIDDFDIEVAEKTTFDNFEDEPEVPSVPDMDDEDEKTMVEAFDEPEPVAPTPPPAPQKPKIISFSLVNETGEAVAKFNIPQGHANEWTFGRKLKKPMAGVDVVIDDGNKSISRKQFKLVYSGTEFSIEDAGSSNGTTVGGMDLFNGMSATVSSGENLKLGKTIYTIIIQEL